MHCMYSIRLPECLKLMKEVGLDRFECGRKHSFQYYVDPNAEFAMASDTTVQTMSKMPLDFSESKKSVNVLESVVCIVAKATPAVYP